MATPESSGGEISQHLCGVACETHVTATYVAPADRDLDDRPAEHACPAQYLDVKGEPVDSREVEEDLGMRARERLESTLGVAQLDVAQGSNELVEGTASQGPKRTSVVDVAVDSSAAHGHWGMIERCEESGDLAGIDCHVGVGEYQSRCICGSNTHPNCCALATVLGLDEYAAVGKARGEGRGHLGGAVSAPVIDVDDLEVVKVDSTLLRSDLEAPESGCEAVALVVGRDDQGGRRRSHPLTLARRPSGPVSCDAR